MSKEVDDKELFDKVDANVRKTGGCYVQTMPKKWTDMLWLKEFWRKLMEGQGEIRLVREHGMPVIELRSIKKEDT